MGVTLTRDDGEPNDCERWMRILGEGVLGGADIWAAMANKGSGGSVLGVYKRGDYAGGVWVYSSTEVN